MDMSTSSIGALNAQAAQHQSELKAAKQHSKAAQLATPSDLVQIDGVEGINNANEDRGPRSDQLCKSLDTKSGTGEGGTAASVTKDAADVGQLDLLG